MLNIYDKNIYSLCLKKISIQNYIQILKICNIIHKLDK